MPLTVKLIDVVLPTGLAQELEALWLEGGLRGTIYISAVDLSPEALWFAWVWRESSWAEQIPLDSLVSLEASRAHVEAFVRRCLTFHDY